MAIKISTDGYVEMYLDREKVMEIKGDDGMAMADPAHTMKVVHKNH